MAATRTYQEALQEYIDIQYAIRVNGEKRDKYEKELAIIYDVLHSHAADIKSDVTKTNAKQLYPNAILYYVDGNRSRFEPEALLELETTLFKQVENSKALKEKELKKESKAGVLAGLDYIMEFRRKDYGGSETDLKNYDNAIEIMAQLLQSNDPNIKARALAILNDERNVVFRERYKELHQPQKKERGSLFDIQSPSQQSSKARIEVDTKTPAFVFLANVKSRIDNLTYNSKGLFDQIGSTIDKLKTALKNLNNVKDIQELTKIYLEVEKIIDQIKEPDRTYKVEKFYADEKTSINDVTNDEKSKTEYLRHFFHRMEDYSNLKKGGGEPKNIEKLNKIKLRHQNDRSIDPLFSDVKAALNKIEPERPIAIRNLFNALKTELKNSKKPDQDDQLRFEQASRYDANL